MSPATAASSTVADPAARATGTATRYDAVVIGAGHNGMVTAAYLARAGLAVGLFEARDRLGGVAGSDPFAGASVNLCNCDHLTFRTTPIRHELDLDAVGLRYVDLEPSQLSMSWSTSTPWASYPDPDRTAEHLAATYPGEVDGFRRYLRDALPAARAVIEAANEPPSLVGLGRFAWQRRLSGIPTLLKWSRRSAADVISSYFSTDAVQGPTMVSGPMVWGITPRTPGTGLGALPLAMRHVGRVGRPVGGSGGLIAALRARFEADGGIVHVSSPVAGIVCEGDRVAGIELVDGTAVDAGIVVSACDPQATFVRWLRNPPAGAASTIERWRQAPHAEGYESKIDAVVSESPRLRHTDFDLGTTLTVAPSIADMHRGAAMIPAGGILDRPALLINVPSLADPPVPPAGGGHVFTLEVLYTPYARPGGWPDSPEPERWLDLVAELMEPGFRESIVDYRRMTPDVYEREFRMPRGHAASFAGGVLAALRNKQPELTRYETPVRGLYLTGAATFPGAGVWGASGRNCATVVLAR